MVKKEINLLIKMVDCLEIIVFPRSITKYCATCIKDLIKILFKKIGNLIRNELTPEITL